MLPLKSRTSSLQAPVVSLERASTCTSMPTMSEEVGIDRPKSPYPCFSVSVAKASSLLLVKAFSGSVHSPFGSGVAVGEDLPVCCCGF